MIAFSHEPVMPEACLEALCVRPDGVYVDATTGGGGHSERIARQLTTGRLLCLDRDTDALQAAGERLRAYANVVTFVHTDFREMQSAAAAVGVTQVDGILFDLGVSSYQLDSAPRGFSYHNEAPLDMRMDQTQDLTAYTVVNAYPQQELARVFREYGEERYAGRIASAVCRLRSRAPIETTTALADCIAQAMPAASRREAQHPARRCFQAIRIEVNGELDAVREGLNAAIELLAPGGTVAVLSFHSLEDRIVKTVFASGARGCTCPPEFPVCVCGKVPRLSLERSKTADAAECTRNPRARSARLRVAHKL